MNFISRWFSKSPSDLLAKGDKYMESESFFEARTCYEDGIRFCSGENADGDLKPVFSERVETANCKLAERNLFEAECAYSRGDTAKAIDHLELVKTLTNNQILQAKAEALLLNYSPLGDEGGEHVSAPSSSCGSCSGSSGSECSDTMLSDDSMPLLEYYELLIHQLPTDQYQRYAQLGEDFAYAYVAASRDHHQEALSGFQNCFDTVPHDIYWYEKGKLLHRLGNDREAEQDLRKAIHLNGANSLAWLSLALILREGLRFQDTLTVVEAMVSNQIMPEQALLIRADICEVTGDHESAINQYVELLQTPYARVAAEKLYVVLQENGRQNDADVIFKKYMKKSCH